MPNYVTNIVSLENHPEQAADLLRQIAFDGHPGTFDFNKVIPMPKGLDLTEGSITDDAIDAFLSAMYQDSEYQLPLDEKFGASNLFSALLCASDIRPFYKPNFRLSEGQITELATQNRIESPGALVRLGKQYLDNYREHGAATWYGWSIKNWGTKWNNDCETPVLDEATGRLCFDTAWSMPEPVFKELSRQYPDLILDVKWADEDIGYNVGAKRYKNGEQIYEYLPEPGSPEAMEMAFDIKGFATEEIGMNDLGGPELDDLIKEAKARSEEKKQASSDKTSPLTNKEAPEL